MGFSKQQERRKESKHKTGFQVLKKEQMGANFQVSNTIQVIKTGHSILGLKRTQKSEGKNYTRHHEEKRSHDTKTNKLPSNALLIQQQKTRPRVKPK